MRFSVFLTLSLSAGAAGFRAKHKRRGQPGEVEALFSIASPSTATPPLQNPLNGPCFPGIRTWTTKQGWWREYDFAPMIAGVAGFAHPYIAGMELDNTTNEVRQLPCDEDTAHSPQGAPPTFSLHDLLQMYIRMQEGISSMLYNISHVGIGTCEMKDRAEASQEAARFGWELIGSAVDSGNWVYVGEQVSHLFQEPHSKDCMLTFMGTKSVQDVVADLNIYRGHFCGFVQQHETCANDETECTVEVEGESFVHSGFRDCLRAMVQNEDWQQDIRPKLSTCSKVHVTGHSLGGSQAELFAACANKQLKPGDYGYEEDYKYIGWTV